MPVRSTEQVGSTAHRYDSTYERGALSIERVASTNAPAAARTARLPKIKAASPPVKVAVRTPELAKIAKNFIHPPQNLTCRAEDYM